MDPQYSDELCKNPLGIWSATIKAVGIIANEIHIIVRRKIK